MNTAPGLAGDPHGDDNSIDDDRADGAEHGWLHQRRYGYDEIYDPWAPEEREERRRNRLERDERRCDGEDGDWSGPATGTKKKKKKKRRKIGLGIAGAAPDHDKT